MPKQLTMTAIALALAVAPGQALAQHEQKSGKEVVETACISCHGSGVNGAPRIGDAKAWQKRAEQGLTSLTQNALNGIRRMPAHGGNPGLSDLEIERAITYMVNQSGGHWIEPIDRASPPPARSAEQVVRSVCAKCHEAGVGGAPKIGDRAAWIPRLKQGVDSLVRSVINGHGGMPPRGGASDLTDAELRSAVVYMFNPAAVAAPKGSPSRVVASSDVALVDNTTVYLGVVPAEVIRSHPGEYPKLAAAAPAGPAQYYVTIALFDAGNGKRIDDAAVKARVSTATQGGAEQTLEPVTIANSRTYGNYFAMGGAGPYKITVDIRRPGNPNPLQAQFEYTH